MQTVTHDLYVHRFYGEGEDDPIYAIADEFGFEFSGAGAGFGQRDLEFSRDVAPTLAEIAGLVTALKALPFTVSAAIERWVYVGDDILEDANECLYLFDPLDFEEKEAA
ncbi:hypothetical protein [Methylorubrum extorquens]|uniref:hypothetical protein n=1 Tax=Methylorubrum extorquens TaxID=408 RepID=UPI0020A0A0AE|nr:hypothetical protein [Methylorubrum extorquens]MCP1540099.1 hypothetical protein [Methylorubrum extorquens]